MRTSLTAFALLTVALPLVAGCPKSEDPPPIPTATTSAAVTATPPPPPPPASVEITTEVDAGPPVEDAAVKKASSKPADVLGLRACCTALKQNAASMPPPNNGYAEAAATMCLGLLSQGATKSSALGPVAAALRGLPLPPACK